MLISFGAGGLWRVFWVRWEHLFGFVPAVAVQWREDKVLRQGGEKRAAAVRGDVGKGGAGFSG